jgi:Ankyrin repeat
MKKHEVVEILHVNHRKYIVMMGGDHNHCCYREQLGYALYAKFREPKLFRMAVAGDWDLIPARCRSHPKEAAFVHKYPPSDTALHRMLRPAFLSCTDSTDESVYDQQTMDKMNELRIGAVAALLETNPQVALIRDSFGRTPLHLACTNATECKFGNAAILIIHANPAVVTVVDSEQRTALHLLVARSNNIPIDLLLLLLQRDPSAIIRSDIVGDSPIEIVKKRFSEIGNAETVLEHMKSAQSTET